MSSNVELLRRAKEFAALGALPARKRGCTPAELIGEESYMCLAYEEILLAHEEGRPPAPWAVKEAQACEEWDRKSQMRHDSGRQVCVNQSSRIERLYSSKRSKIFEKFSGYCAYCEEMFENDFHLDHVMPKSAGGGNMMSNMAASCRRCNMAKGAGVYQ